MNWLDRTINFLSPKWGAERQASRIQSDALASYRAAIPTRTSTQWSASPSMTGIPSLTLGVARQLRDRARSLVDNNPFASSILDRSVENIIGHGYGLQVLTDDPEWNKKAEELFHGWFDSMDYYGRSWTEHQELACYGLLRDGDFGGYLLSNGQVQTIEGDYISSPYDKWKSFYHDGIELDKNGRVANYYVMTFVDAGQKEWQPVKRKDLLFVANRRRSSPAQLRGETAYAQTFPLFDQVSGYVDATVLAQKIAACMALFIRVNDTSGSVRGLNAAIQNAQGQPQRALNLEPGSVQRLGIGEDIVQVKPEQPGTGFSDNMRMLGRLLGLNFGLPLEYALLDFSDASGNTAKASQMHAQRAFERHQRRLIDSYYKPLYRWRVSKFINDGLLEERPDAFKHKWHPAPWPYLDPVKELQAVKLAIDCNLTSERAAVMARGGNYDQIIEQRAKEEAGKKVLGLPQYHSTLMMPFGENAPTVSIKDQNDTDIKGTDAEKSNGGVNEAA